MLISKRILILAFLSLTARAAAPLVDYVSYLGGSYTDTAAGIAVDSTGAAYVAGTTNSPDFPLTSTTLGAPSTNNSCAFVTKFNPSGSAIDFSVCLAGTSAIAGTSATAFALDPAGNMYLALVISIATGTSSAIVKLDPTGQTILYTYPIAVVAESIAVDASGNVYLTGTAGSGLVTTPGVYQPNIAGADQCGKYVPSPCNNAFITKLSPSGVVAWTTYLGGSGPDDAHAIAVDSAGNVWVAGETASTNFPTTPGAISSTFHGAIDLGPLVYGDAFVAKLDPTGSHLLYSTYLGGSAPDAAFAIAVDPTGAAYIAGGTQSTDFPTTSGSLAPTYTGNPPPPTQPPSLTGNGFVTKLDASGNLIYSTFTGIPNSQSVAIAVDNTGQAYASVTGVASSSLIQNTCPASQNPAVIVLNPAGSALTATSPIPGAYLALDGKGGLYSAGLAYALVFFSTPHAFQTEYGGGDSDAFAAKVDLTQSAAPSLASVLNAASLLPGYGSSFPWGAGAIAPGELVTLFGNGFGSSPTVTFGTSPAPVIYASDCQINAVVPFEVPPGGPVPVTVQFDTETLGPVKLPVVTAQPGIFAILNQDNTVNSSSNPAPPGSIVSVFMTGTGSLTPPLADGSLGPLTSPFPAPAAGVSVTIDSVNASVVFVGQAPGLIAGVTQVNVQIAPNTPIGTVPVTIYAAYYASQPGFTVAIQ
jgi:uncharacterized protein (TIGR03437 family)